jgi:tetratricopeptide (TPR) repeat protein
LWAETYDRDLTAEDIFDIQDAITEQVVATLASSWGVLSRSERWQAKKSSTGSLQAYDCVLLAQAYPVVATPEYHLMVRDCLAQTVEVDPSYVDAWAWLSYIYNIGYAQDYNPQPDYLDRGWKAAQQAIRLDPTNQLAQFAMAISHYFRRELDDFREEAETAIVLNPNNADVIAELGKRLVYMGQWERGAALMRKAMTLNPMHPTWYWFPLAKYHLFRGEFDQAITAAQKINMPDYYIFYCVLAYVYAHAGRQIEAEQAAASALEVYPDATVEQVAQLYDRWNFTPDFIERFAVEGLRKAGLPEGGATN